MSIQLVDILAIFIGFCALVVSICAIVISIWQGSETRKNYHLSVTPFISIFGNWVIESDFIGIKIENKGIGPAIINNIIIKIDDQILCDIYTQFELLNYLFENTKFSGVSKLCYHTFSIGEMISADEKIPYIWLDDTDKVNASYITAFQEALKKVTIMVHYKSIYNEPFSIINSNFVPKGEYKYNIFSVNK